MKNQPVLCPTCRRMVDLHHDDTKEDPTDYTSPWVFVDHDRDDWRDGENVPRRCTASGQNITTARFSDEMS